MKKIIIYFITLLACESIITSKTLNISLKGEVKIKAMGFSIGRIASVVVDGEGAIYILDKPSNKIHKFSSNGTFINSFGRKGEGPGDLRFPGILSIDERGNIAVGEMMNWISFFDKKGNYLDKIDFSKELKNIHNIGYIENNLFCGEITSESQIKKQVIFNIKGEIIYDNINKTELSLEKLDNGGVFTFSMPAYDKSNLLRNINEGCAVFSNPCEYSIKLFIDGKFITISRSDVAPIKISSKERDWIKNKILNIKMNLPKSVLNSLINKIPKNKNFIDALKVHKKGIWISRVSEDITDENLPKTVDLISPAGVYLGSFQIKKWPIYVTPDFLYMTDEDDDGAICLKKYSYYIE